MIAPRHSGTYRATGEPGNGRLVTPSYGDASTRPARLQEAARDAEVAARVEAAQTEAARRRGLGAKAIAGPDPDEDQYAEIDRRVAAIQAQAQRAAAVRETTPRPEWRERVNPTTTVPRVPPNPNTPAPDARCDECGYALTSKGHRYACGDDL